jgi:hypothetical protein
MIPKHKIGNCSQCGDENVPCVKVRKDLYCLYKCHRRNKVAQQQQKASLRASVSKLPTLSHEDKSFIDSRNSLIQDLDAVVSKYVRVRDADEKGICTCYTCGVRKHFTLMQNGHFVSRSHIGLRFDAKRNLRTQCQKCNEFLRGNLKVYAQRLNEEQNGLPEQLQEQAREVEHIGIDELKSMLIDYRAKLKTVEQKLIK